MSRTRPILVFSSQYLKGACGKKKLLLFSVKGVGRVFVREKQTRLGFMGWPKKPAVMTNLDFVNPLVV